MMHAIEVEESNNGATKKFTYSCEYATLKRNADAFVAQFCNDEGVVENIKKKIGSMGTGKVYSLIFNLSGYRE